MSLKHRVDKVFGIKDDENPRVSGPQFAAGSYIETEPTSGDFFREVVPTVDGIKTYVHSLFPFLSWIAHYNLTWLFGDLIAGKCFGRFYRHKVADI